jgi:hypothetical protein
MNTMSAFTFSRMFFTLLGGFFSDFRYTAHPGSGQLLAMESGFGLERESLHIGIHGTK